MASPAIVAVALRAAEKRNSRSILAIADLVGDVRSDHAANIRRLFTGQGIAPGEVAFGSGFTRRIAIMSRRQYVGAIAYLRGQTAFVEARVGIPGQVMALFEAPYLQEAKGWWEFPETDFAPTAGLEIVGGQCT